MLEVATTLAHFLVANIWLILFGVISLLYYFGTRNFGHWKRHGIPGPTPLPFIGTFFSLRKPIPVLYQEHMKQYGKFYGGFRFNRPALFVSDPEVIKRILVRDFHLFRNRAGGRGHNKTANSNLVVARNEQWKRIRSLLTPMFTSAKMRKMEPQIKQCTKSMLDAFDKSAGTNNNNNRSDKPTVAAAASPEGTTNKRTAVMVAHDAMGNFTMDVIAKCAFATDTNAHEDADNVFVRHAREVMRFKIHRFLLTPFVPKLAYKVLRSLKSSLVYSESGEFFFNLSKHLIRERQTATKSGEKKYDDMLQLMVNAEFNEKDLLDAYANKEDQLEAHHVNVGSEEAENETNLLKTVVDTKKLTEEEILANAMVFFLAGYETTASTLSFCMFELAVNPDVQERLYREIQEAKRVDPELTSQTIQHMAYLDAVLSEALRKYPPAMMIGREYNGTEPYPIPQANYTLQTGDYVQFPICAIHHCPDYYPEPDRFNPDRFMPENRHNIIPYTYLPFGGGPRNCIGMRFALTEAKLGLVQIVDRFRIVRTGKTPDKLRLKLGFPLLKTEPIVVGVQMR